MPQQPHSILMIGNSFCMNFLTELHGMAAEAGIRCRISSVIAPACTLHRHWAWLQTGGKNYLLRTVDAAGFREEEGLGLDDCLRQADWDVVSYQDGEHFYRTGGLEAARSHMEPCLGGLVRYVRERFPHATHCFHQVWAYQVGYDRPEKSSFRVPDRATQQQMHADLQAMCLEACRRHGLVRIPAGAVWEAARSDPRIGDTLCCPDCEHESDLQGGRYLNACIWFECLFRQSCVGNAYRPPYALAEDRLAAIQAVVHQTLQG